jgi:hypothetical protein
MPQLAGAGSRSNDVGGSGQYDSAKQAYIHLVDVLGTRT